MKSTYLIAEEPRPNCEGEVSVLFFKAASIFIRCLASLEGDVTIGNDDENDEEEDDSKDDDSNDDDDLVNISSPNNSRTSSL